MTRCPRCQRRLPRSGECAIHGPPPPAPAPAEAAGALDAEPLAPVVAPRGWRLGAPVAEGGSARVFVVHHDSGRDAILKWGRWRGRDLAARFDLEAEVLRALGPPVTPTYLAHGAVDGTPYLLMERVPGETLAAWMSRAGARGGIGEILGILDRLAATLAALHARGIVHRDLKPENVVIGAQGVRLLDFGLALVRGGPRGAAQIGDIVGTAHYLAPEQVRAADDIDHRADLYSLGVVAFEMLTGVPPFVGERRALEYLHLVGRPPAVRETRAVPPELDELVLACLAKQPDARPRDADEVRARLAGASAHVSTLRGHGPEPVRRPGVTGDVALLWIEGGDPVEVARAIAEVSGIVARRQGDGIVAAFTPQLHDAPLDVALETCRALTREPEHARARAVVHAGNALMRRTRAGRPVVYGDDIARPERWLPAAPFTGMLLTAAAASLVPGTARPAPEAARFFRERRRERTDATDAAAAPRFVGREPLVRSVVAAAARPVAVELVGPAGMGKTRALAEIVERLRAGGRRVAVLRARPRFPGDLPDDARLAAALGGRDLAAGLALAQARGTLVAIDDVHHLSAGAIAALADAHARGLSCLATAPAATLARAAPDARALELPLLEHADADTLLRDLLRPVRLLPGVLVERLALRGAGHPGVLVALARDLMRRGAVRRHPGGDEWYVAADELDTLLAPPGPAWFAARTLEDLAPELAPVARACAALGPRFRADEVAAVLGIPDAAARLARLAREGVLAELAPEGDDIAWYEYADPATQDALYDHVLDERRAVHARALRHWQAHRLASAPGWLARLAHHAAGAGESTLAATCLLALERAARSRGDAEHAGELLVRAFNAIAGTVPPAIAAAARELV